MLIDGVRLLLPLFLLVATSTRIGQSGDRAVFSRISTSSVRQTAHQPLARLASLISEIDHVITRIESFVANMLQLVPRNQRDYRREQHVRESSSAAFPEASHAFSGTNLFGTVPDACGNERLTSGLENTRNTYTPRSSDNSRMRIIRLR